MAVRTVVKVVSLLCVFLQGRLHLLLQVSTKLQALHSAFKRRSDERQISHTAHKLAVGVLDFDKCLTEVGNLLSFSFSCVPCIFQAAVQCAREWQQCICCSSACLQQLISKPPLVALAAASDKSVASSKLSALALQGQGCQQQLQQLKDSCAQDPVTQAAVGALLQHGGSQVRRQSMCAAVCGVFCEQHTVLST